MSKSILIISNKSETITVYSDYHKCNFTIDSKTSIESAGYVNRGTGTSKTVAIYIGSYDGERRPVYANQNDLSWYCTTCGLTSKVICSLSSNKLNEPICTCLEEEVEYDESY